MTGSRSIATVLAGLALMVVMAPAASAATTQEIVRSDTTLWAEATVEDAAPVTITILAPKADGEGREVWQRCRFTAVDAGTFRCGVDVTEGSLAAARKGYWVSKVSVDGDVASRTRFTI